MKLAEKVINLFEVNFKRRKILGVKIDRLTITVTWAAVDSMDDNVVKEFPVVGHDLKELVHLWLSSETSAAEKKKAKEDILKKILKSY